MIHTHVVENYAPFSTKMVNVDMRDSIYVLDGSLCYKSDLRIEEHHTDTAGFIDYVFALMHMLESRFVPCIRHFGDTKLYISGAIADYPALKAMIGGTLRIKHLRAHWDDILCLVSSIKHGAVTACCANSVATRTRTA
jgi:TnpA family transposase